MKTQESKIRAFSAIAGDRFRIYTIKMPSDWPLIRLAAAEGNWEARLILKVGTEALVDLAVEPGRCLLCTDPGETAYLLIACTLPPIRRRTLTFVVCQQCAAKGRVFVRDNVDAQVHIMFPGSTSLAEHPLPR